MVLPPGPGARIFADREQIDADNCRAPQALGALPRLCSGTLDPFKSVELRNGRKRGNGGKRSGAAVAVVGRSRRRGPLVAGVRCFWR